MDVLVDWVLKMLPSLQLTFGCPGMCCTDKVSLLWSSGSGKNNSSVYNKGLPSVMKKMSRFVCAGGCVPNSDISGPKLADFSSFI